ncbi:exoribonuclease II [Candidatus Tachikawaea gelatinosa]|uniref:Exoribonuclease II n=1 Tax=Candidatus Tachikawaea gelatinosa TaxID=1410383 RepID=A0A090AM61_9ENTR|nr:exoribonuclease II [Candidatus Tachikawaea gelatinosa]BAP58744.1 exoribonuclease 2 [Candidatus Tachikawaea gelatinosa]
MLHDNPILIKLKNKFKENFLRIEGTVKKNNKGYCSLETVHQKSFFIPSSLKNKVMNGDKITALVYLSENCNKAEPEKLIEPFLKRFVGQIKKENNRFFIYATYKYQKEKIICFLNNNVQKKMLKTGDWLIAEMCGHPLNGNDYFYAKLITFIARETNYLVPWLVTLSRYDVEYKDLNIVTEKKILDISNKRIDLTHLDFITIDNSNTEDIDDALYIEEISKEVFCLTIAIADPTAYFSKNSEVDKTAEKRAFTYYFPGFNIPMLPYQLSENLCSLKPSLLRSALVCRVKINKIGTIINNSIEFFLAWIKSKEKLAYYDVSNFLEKKNSKKEVVFHKKVIHQLKLLYSFYLIRRKWRYENTLILKSAPEYRFSMNEKGKITNIFVEYRRTANYIVEEAMIIANICAGKFLKDKLGFGIYNIYTGFDDAHIEEVVQILLKNGIQTNNYDITTVKGFCKIYRQLNNQKNQYLLRYIRKFQNFQEIKTKSGPHFGLGTNSYATWTSPIRKYSDLINHRLIKSVIFNNKVECPKESIVKKIHERRRMYRVVEREIKNWLYAQYISSINNKNYIFKAEIISILRFGIRVCLIENGAIAFIPLSFIVNKNDFLFVNNKQGILYLKKKILYKISDIIYVKIHEVKLDTNNIVVKPSI